MFSHLLASASGRAEGVTRRQDLMGSSACHLGFVGMMFWVGGFAHGELAPKEPDEQVTYVDVAELDERAATDVEEVPPAPDEPERNPEEREFPPEVEVDPELLAGFQELLDPDLLEGIPEPDLLQPRVSALDFGGRGSSGGVAHGRATRLSAGGTGGTGQESPASLVFLPEAVDEIASVRNLAELGDIIRELYPGRMRALGREATVRVRFVVTEDGLVDPTSIGFQGEAPEAFVAPTIQLLTLLRWHPARRGTQAVALLVEMPVNWVLPR